MSNILSRIDDDIEEYVALCHKFGEEVRYSPTSTGVMVEDCYGAHAKSLKQRNSEDKRLEVQPK